VRRREGRRRSQQTRSRFAARKKFERERDKERETRDASEDRSRRSRFDGDEAAIIADDDGSRRVPSFATTSFVKKPNGKVDRSTAVD
jgi:hypothetical protein